jgi:acetylcholinesterase
MFALNTGPLAAVPSVLASHWPVDLLSRLSSALTVLLGATASASAPNVTIRNGTYTGIAVPSFKQELFLGMPYAQQPLPPDLRLRAPRSLEAAWTGARDATAYSPICIGVPPLRGDDEDLGYERSEACLTLNVVRPEGINAGSNVPVMVWI